MPERRVRARLEISGFKGIGSRQVIELAPLTLFLGPNSAGKSSVLEALRTLVSLATSPGYPGATELLFTPDGFERLAHDGDIDSGIQVSLSNDRSSRSRGWGEFHNELEIPAVSITAKAFVPGARVPSMSAGLSDARGDIFSVSVRPLALNHDHPVFADWLANVKLTLQSRARYSRGIDTAMTHFVEAFCSAVNFSWWLRRGRRQWGGDARYEEDAGVDQWLGPFMACELALSTPESNQLLHDLSSRLGIRGTNWLCEATEAGYDLDKETAALVDAHLTSALEEAIEQLDEERPSHDDARRPYERAVAAGRRLLETLHEDAVAALPTIRHFGPHREPQPRLLGGHMRTAAISDIPAIDASVNAWLGSDRLARGYRYVIEPLFRSSEAALLSATSTDETRSIVEAAGYEHYLVDLRTGMRLSFSDVGYGLSQVLPVLVGLHDQRFEYVLVEQPESQLHPALQAELADEMIRATNQSYSWRCIITETHSEHIVLRLLRRIRDTTRGEAAKELQLHPDDVSLVFLDRVDGEARVRHIRVSDEGWFLDPWPYGFFPERLEDLG